MGLDIVEFVMEVEEAFELRIPDKIAASLTTRKLIDYIYCQLPPSRESRCLSQMAFYKIRRTLGARLGLSRQTLRPSTDLLSVLPTLNPQAIWAEVGASLGCSQWPRARGSGWFARNFLQFRPRTLAEAARHVATFTPNVLKPAEEGWSWSEVAAVVDGLIYMLFGQ